LRAAELCFAERGYEGSSLRDITRVAKANLAAVNYHFSSKKDLWIEVMQRRMGPLNLERRRLLAEVTEAAPARGPLALEKVCQALLSPVARVYYAGGDSPAVVSRMIGRIFSEPNSLRQELDRRGLSQSGREFRAALRRALPGLTAEEFKWKYYFCICSLLGALARQGRQPGMQGPLDTSDIEELIRHLGPFLCGGLRERVPSKRKKSRS
jgi:AcrR family transcriptional regulator